MDSMPSITPQLHTQAQYLQPAGLYDCSPNGYTHVVTVQEPLRWLFVSGQGGEDAQSELPDSFAQQATQALANIKIALTAGGADMGHEQPRFHLPHKAFQVRVRPGGHGVAVQARLCPFAVPAQPEPVAIDRRVAARGADALMDQRMAGTRDDIFEKDRLSDISRPTTHAPAPIPALRCDFHNR